MNRPPTFSLTWGTLAAAVASACLLATGESGLPENLLGTPLGNALFAPPGPSAAHALLPIEPTGAGLKRGPATH